MIRALIISYHALPMDVVSSYRAKGYCDYFKSHDVSPTLLTHRWERQDGEYVVHDRTLSPLVEQHATHRIIRLPYPGRIKSKSPFHTAVSYLRGNIETELSPSYEVFKAFLDRHLNDEKYDLIIAIFSPHFHLKLAYECGQKFRIPYVLDFRDLWDNSIVAKGYRPSFKKRIIDAVIRYWWKKWIKQSLFFSITGYRWKVFLENLTDKEGLVVRNGFEWGFDIEAREFGRQKKFKIIHFGRMYARQDITPFVQGFKLFASAITPEQAGVEIIGLKKIPEMDYHAILRNSLGEYVTILPYMSKVDLMRYCGREASLFLFPNFKVDDGSFNVKLYDYIILKRNIIVFPSGGEAEEVISETKTGVVLNTAEEIYEYLNNSYHLFKKTGVVPVASNDALINKYSRQNQVRILAEQIHRKLVTQRR